MEEDEHFETNQGQIEENDQRKIVTEDHKEKESNRNGTNYMTQIF